MTRVSFAEFYGACKERLTERQLKELNPYALYYLVSGAYIGLEYYAGLGAFFVWIAVAGNDKDWWRVFFRYAHENGVKEILYCAPDGRGTKSFCHYAGGTIEQGRQEGMLLCRFETDTRRMNHGRQ